MVHGQNQWPQIVGKDGYQVHRKRHAILHLSHWVGLLRKQEKFLLSTSRHQHRLARSSHLPLKVSPACVHAQNQDVGLSTKTEEYQHLLSAPYGSSILALQTRTN